MTLKCLLTFSFIARHTFSIFCTPSATSHSCIEPKHCNQPVNICNQLLFLSTSSQSEISVHDKTLSERPQTFLLATVPIRSKDRVCWNHICVESFGARVQALLVWGWGGGMKGRILYLHLCGTRGQSSKMKCHSSSEVTRWDTIQIAEHVCSSYLRPMLTQNTVLSRARGAIGQQQ